MSRLSTYVLPIVAFCMFACRLPADPITLSATSATTASSGCSTSFCFADISVSGPSFTLFGTPYTDGGFAPFPVPEIFPFPNPTSFDVSGTSLGPAGLRIVDGQFAGTLVDYYGSATVTAMSFFLTCPSPETTGGCIGSPTFTLTAGDINLTITPTSPSATFVLPATMSGSFSACAASLFVPVCSPPPTIGDVAIDLPGDLTVNLSAFYVSPPNTFVSHWQISESFVSTPVPEPETPFLTALGVALMVAISFRRKQRSQY